ncbi:MAG: hypothetical protein ABL964_16665 [Steroidobacteraceae bacterium]
MVAIQVKQARQQMVRATQLSENFAGHHFGQYALKVDEKKNHLPKTLFSLYNPRRKQG